MSNFITKESKICVLLHLFAICCVWGSMPNRGLTTYYHSDSTIAFSLGLIKCFRSITAVINLHWPSSAQCAVLMLLNSLTMFSRTDFLVVCVHSGVAVSCMPPHTWFTLKRMQNCKTWHTVLCSTIEIACMMLSSCMVSPYLVREAECTHACAHTDTYL
jgi:hypothetical protein